MPSYLKSQLLAEPLESHANLAQSEKQAKGITVWKHLT